MALYEISPTNMRGSGTFFMGRAGEALGRCALVYKAADGAWYLADADAAATMPVIGLTMEPVIAGQIVRILEDGFIGRSTWTWTPGGEIYASTTPGELTQVAPAGAGDVVQIVAMATSPVLLKFSSDMGSGGGECALLAGATAYVGFDSCLSSAHSNYFLADGVADEVQIQQALALVTASGIEKSKVVLLGDFTTSVAINVPSNVIIEIQGSITISDAGNETIFILDGVNDIEIKDGILNGNKAAKTGGNAIFITGVSNDIIIDKLRIYDTNGHSIRLQTGTFQRIYIQKNYITGTDSDSDSIFVGSASENIYILENTITLAERSAIAITNASDITISKNKIINCFRGINVETNVTESLIEGNTIDTISSTYGIQLRGAAVNLVTKCLVSGNKINAATTQGIRVDQYTDDNEIIGNIG